MPLYHDAATWLRFVPWEWEHQLSGSTWLVMRVTVS